MHARDPSNLYPPTTSRRSGWNDQDSYSRSILNGGSEKRSSRLRSRPGSTTPYRLRDPENSMAPFWCLRKSTTTDGKDHFSATSESSLVGTDLYMMFRYASSATQGTRVLKDALAFSWSSNRRKFEMR